ncbi:MAG TPA: HAMP domain-containing sensor histidine kinase [Actinomycetota bacterium]|nr:HAMP domain-containing sensor histidine kinase [Actinomycetota bacterium]
MGVASDSHERTGLATRSASEGARELSELGPSVAASVREALGTERASVAISVPDAGGRLRSVWAEDVDPAHARLRASRRRSAFLERATQRVVLTTDGGSTLAFVPLLAGGTAVGVLEVRARDVVEERRWAAVEAVAGPLAVAIRALSERSRLRARAGALEEVVELVRRLLAAPSDHGALRAAARYLAERWGGPVGAWLAPDASAPLRFALGRGLGASRERRLAGTLRQLPPWSELGEPERREVLDAFASAVGAPAVPVDAGRALLLAARANGDEVAVGELASVLRAVLDHRERNVRLVPEGDRGVGVAWAAHELRRPLIGVRAVLEYLLREEADEGRRWMLTRSVEEMQRLTELVEGLLRWSAGEAPLERRRVELPEVVRSALATCGFETGQADRIVLRADGPAAVLADPQHLGVAIANLVRNALAYSPEGSQVVVRVGTEGGRATVSVQDRGPGVPPEEREAVFEPFVRGSRAPARPGSGLGLFIAKRVIEAHGGELRLEPAPVGATFRVELPMEVP